MMKSLLLKSIIATCVTGISILLTPKASVAQVNMRFLIEVTKSCQKDLFSMEYHQQMGHNKFINKDYSGVDRYLRYCIESRYFYLLAISKLPWLVQTKEMLPGYPGAVAVSQIAYMYSNSDGISLVDCLSSRDSNSEDCRMHLDTSGRVFQGLYPSSYSSTRKMNLFKYVEDSRFAYLCPSCYSVYNNNPSERKMIDAFMEWFRKLESSQRKELVSVLLGGEQKPKNNRINMNEEIAKAWEEFKAVRRRIAEEEKQQKRRELFE